MSIHELKCWPIFFEPLMRGDKTFEARRNDRDFKVGDTLIQREWSESTGYTGRVLRHRVTYILSDPAFGTQPGWVVMGIRPL